MSEGEKRKQKKDYVKEIRKKDRKINEVEKTEKKKMEKKREADRQEREKVKEKKPGRNECVKNRTIKTMLKYKEKNRKMNEVEKREKDKFIQAEQSDTMSNVKLGGFRSQLQVSYASSHTEELWYNETVYLWMTIYIYFFFFFFL